MIVSSNEISDRKGSSNPRVSTNPSAKFGGDWEYNGICGLYLLGIDTDMIMAEVSRIAELTWNRYH